MKTKIIFLFLFGVSIISNAQLAGKKFKLMSEQNGTFYLEFKDATYELTNPMGDVAVKGTYKIKESTILFIDKEGPMACPEEQVGKYKYSIKNDELKLELIEDKCTGRPNMATNLWKLVEK